MPATQAAVTANPLATRAALKMLEAGGSSIDGAIAAQMVLGLVEPQSSGIGGGSLIMYWDAATKKLTSFDGLAAAPARVTTALTVDLDGTLLRSADMARGGRTVGVPGTLAVLKQVHERYGKLPWARLFSPAIELAESGFAMPNYLHEVLTGLGDAKDHPDLAQIFFDAGGKVLPVGSKLTNPAYAKTLRRVAEMGPVGLWQGDAGATLLALAQHGYRPSLMTEADFSAYSPKLREPVCAPFLAYSVCSMAPASFGGVMVLQILQMLEARTGSSSDLTRFDFDNSEFVHYYAEAGRLAQADRLHYIGDPDFVRVPTLELVAGQYLRNRARLIDPLHTTMDVKAGDLTTGGIALESAALSEAADATSQLAIVDAQGSALSMTTTINLNFGSHLMVDGFVLNNALTNFSSAPRSGEAAPNRMQGGKRPVTSMAPTIVFDKSGQPIVVGGSAGGGQIVDYICTSLVEMLANQRSPAEAVSKGHVSTASRGKLQLEKGSAAAAQAVSLAAKGHHIEIVPMVSGLGFLKRRDTGWIGAADPRRDGVALGR
jgi:gamma-glutamyltranspeptidase/glutathione hydrolase